MSSFSKQYLVELYNSLQTGTLEEINQANQIILELQKNAQIEYLIYAAEILLSDDVSQFCISMAAINIGQILTPNIYVSFNYVNNFWKTKVPDDCKAIIKEGIFRGLMFENQQVRITSARSLAMIARIEIYNGEWLDFYQKLGIILLNNEYNDWAKMGALQCFCEIFQMKKDLNELFPKKYNLSLAEVSKNLFNIIIDIIGNKDSCQNLLIYAANCLNSFISYICYDVNLEALIQILSSELEKSNNNYTGIIFDILTKVIHNSYKNLNQYIMKIIFNGVVFCLNSDDMKKIYQGIQFCTEVSEIEHEILQILTIKQDFCSFHNLTGVLTESLTQKLLSFMTIINEDDLNDSLYVISKKCLKTFTKINIVTEKIVVDCLNYYQHHYNDNDWHSRFSSIIAILSIIDTSNQILIDNIKLLLNNTINIFKKSNEIIIKKYLLKLIKSILSHYFDISFDNEILYFIIDIIRNHEFVFANEALKVLSIIMKKIEKLDEQMLDNLSSLLFQTIKRNDIFNDEFLETSIKAMVSLIQAIPKESVNFIFSLYSIGFNTFQLSLQTSFPDQASQFRIQSGLCSILYYIILKFENLSEELSNVFDITANLINILYNLIDNSSLLEVEALKLITTLVLFFGDIFHQDFKRLLNILIKCLNQSSPELVTLSGRLIGDLFKLGFKEQLVQFIDNIIEIMFNKINEFSYLPYNSLSIFFAIGDIISVLSDYSTSLIQKLIQIIRHFNQNIVIPENDEDLTYLFLETLFYVSTRIILLNPSLREIQSCKILFFAPIKKYYYILLKSPDYVKIYFLDFIIRISSNFEIKKIFNIQIHSLEVRKLIEYYSNSSNKNILSQTKKLKKLLNN